MADTGGIPPLQAETPQVDPGPLQAGASSTMLEGGISESSLNGQVNDQFTNQNPGPGAYCPRLPKVPNLKSLIPKTDKPSPKPAPKFAGKVTAAPPLAAQTPKTAPLPPKTAPTPPQLVGHVSTTVPEDPVLFGLEGTVEEKKHRAQKRQALIRSGLSVKPGNPATALRLKNALDRLQLENLAVEIARLAANVYHNAGSPAPVGWNRLSDNPANLPLNLKNFKWDDPQTGFRAALYKSRTGQTVLVFQGTNATSVIDWVNNVQQGLGYGSAQYEQAMQLAKLVQDDYGSNFIIGGHSLGGGLAAAASAVTGVPAYTFNAAGLNPDTVAGRAIPHYASEIDNFSVDGEILTSAQNPWVNIITIPNLRKWIYSAAGRQHQLAALNPNNTPATLSLDPKARVLQMVDRHGMDFVLRGMEAQKLEDQQTIKSIVAPGA